MTLSKDNVLSVCSASLSVVNVGFYILTYTSWAERYDLRATRAATAWIVAVLCFLAAPYWRRAADSDKARLLFAAITSLIVAVAGEIVALSAPRF
jgi:hypothetical protein